MKLSTRSRYGARILCCIAELDTGDYISLNVVSDRLQISRKYAEQLVRHFVNSGYLESARGPYGGYKFSRPPREITIADVVRLLDGGLRLVECSDDNGKCVNYSNCAMRRVWELAADSMTSELSKISIHELAGHAMDRYICD
jgi:Rrf2 family protein